MRTTDERLIKVILTLRGLKVGDKVLIQRAEDTSILPYENGRWLEVIDTNDPRWNSPCAVKDSQSGGFWLLNDYNVGGIEIPGEISLAQE